MFLQSNRLTYWGVLYSRFTENSRRMWPFSLVQTTRGVSSPWTSITGEIDLAIGRTWRVIQWSWPQKESCTINRFPRKTIFISSARPYVESRLLYIKVSGRQTVMFKERHIMGKLMLNTKHRFHVNNCPSYIKKESSLCILWNEMFV